MSTPNLQKIRKENTLTFISCTKTDLNQRMKFNLKRVNPTRNLKLSP